MIAALALALTTRLLLVQSATLDLTPPEPLPLGGYTERRGALAEPGGDRLETRAVILGAGERRVAIVTVEMLTVPESLDREVRSRIPEDLPLFLVATHTHCAPDSQMLNERMTMAIPGIASFRRRWLEWYAERIARCVRLALDTAPARYPILELREFRLPLNRPRRPGALPDSLASVLSVPGRVLLVLYAAHATVYPATERRTRGDWAGAVARALGAPVLPGAIGDVSPVGGGSPEEICQRFVAAVREGLARAVPRRLRPEPFRLARVPIDLGPATPHPDFPRAYGLPAPLATDVSRRFAPTAAEVLAIRIGKLAIVGIPAEPTSALGQRIRLIGLGLGFEAVWVVSHAGGWIGYVLESDDYRRGGYEATLSFYGPDLGDRLLAAGRRALEQLGG